MTALTAFSVEPPFPIFTAADGSPLEDGYIWIGQENLDPQTNPVQVYWDSNLTQPAAQPIRTIGGYPSNNGTPEKLYSNGNFSIRVQNKNGSTVYSSPSSDERISSSLITFVQAGTGAVVRSAQEKMRETVSLQDFGATGNGTTDDTAAIQSAIQYAAANDVRLTGSGSFKISSKIVINCAFDGSDMTFLVYGAPSVAVEISTGSAINPTDIFSLATELGIILPSVINMTKPATGWVGQGIGVRYVNVQNMKITERLVENFSIGIQAISYSQGCGYNTIQGGYLRNNKVNRQIVNGDNTGFTNRWDYYGGRYFHSSSEGTEVAGVYHIEVVAGSSGLVINDHNFFGASLEGVAEQYHVINGGLFINFFGCRWESSSPGGIKVHLAYNGISGQGSIGIFNGRGASREGINITADPGAAKRINLQSTSGGNMISTPNTYVLKNSNSSASPSIAVYDAATDHLVADPLTDYAVSIAAHAISGKRETDSENRIEVDTQNGRIYFGSGSAAPTQYIARLGTAGIGPLNTGLSIPDGITTPGQVVGFATMYIDSADGDFKIRFGDGTIKTIVTNP